MSDTEDTATVADTAAVTQAPAADYSEAAIAAFAAVDAARAESVNTGESDFDMAYRFARDAIAKVGEIDSNALFLAITAQQQNRKKAQQQTAE